MNLIHEPWLTAKRQSGIIECIAPYQVTDNYQADPVIDLIIPRPDFKGAVMQCLIGLLQTTFSNLQPYQWRTWRKSPPTSNELKAKFLPFVQAFAIDIDGPRFMQDLELSEAEFKPINSLLLEQPGENTLKNNTDHFIKRAQVNEICPICAVMALLTLQINAPSGGAGHRTSIRGGGPLTTLVIEKPLNNRLPTLWQNLWLNVRANVQEYKIPEDESLHRIFPWLAATRTSEARTGLDTTIEDVHPLQLFWAMPRRICLDFTKTTSGHCDLCGVEHQELLTQYQTKNYGINYTGTWEHPLSPYSQKADGEWLPLHPQPGGIGYKHWLNLTLGINGKINKRPAAVIAAYVYEQGRRLPDELLQIWSFGYDMENMKARCWYESHLPLEHIPADYLSEFQEAVGKLLEAADLVLSYARSALKKANGDLNRLETCFWHETEQSFYQSLKKIRETIQTEQSPVAIYEQWRSILIGKGQVLFKRIAMVDMTRKAKLYNELTKYLQGKKLRLVLGLAIPSKKETKNAING